MRHHASYHFRDPIAGSQGMFVFTFYRVIQKPFVSGPWDNEGKRWGRDRYLPAQLFPTFGVVEAILLSELLCDELYPLGEGIARLWCVLLFRLLGSEISKLVELCLSFRPSRRLACILRPSRLFAVSPRITAIPPCALPTVYFVITRNWLRFYQLLESVEPWPFVIDGVRKRSLLRLRLFGETTKEKGALAKSFEFW